MYNNSVNQEETSKKQDLTPIRNEKGQIISGTANPNGRPKGAKNYETIMWEALKMIGEAQDNKKTKEEVFADLHKKGLLKAIQGDFKFYQDALDRFYGKPNQTIKNEFDEDVERIEVKIVKSNDNRANSNRDISED